MLRYQKLPPGASWIGEYGNPDIPEQAAYIAKYSPYQNVKKGVKYPRVFFYTSTGDDRVQPGHTRKMVARMESFGDDVLLYENTEGGHGAAADLEQTIQKTAMEYTYLLKQLK
jgi:prolyl oligopeptidase